jgi:hypothetical protein
MVFSLRSDLRLCNEDQRNKPIRTVFRITFFNSLPVVDKRLIGCKFWGNFGSLLGFGNIMTFASFQDFRKWDNLRQWLNKRVRCITGVLGRWLRHSFAIPSSPQDFLNFNAFTNFCMSQVLTYSMGVASTGVTRAWTLASTCCSWFSSHRSWDVNWFPKQSAIGFYRKDFNLRVVELGVYLCICYDVKLVYHIVKYRSQ